MKRNPIIQSETSKLVLSMVLVFLFAYTAGSKLIDFSMFYAQLSLFPFVGNLSWLLSIVIPGAELIISLLLLLPSTRAKGFFFSFILLFLFTAYLILMIGTQSNLPCSCGGVVGKLSWQEHIVFNTCFILVSLTGVWLEQSNRNSTFLPSGQADK